MKTTAPPTKPNHTDIRTDELFVIGTALCSLIEDLEVARGARQHMSQVRRNCAIAVSKIGMHHGARGDRRQTLVDQLIERFCAIESTLKYLFDRACVSPDVAQAAESALTKILAILESRRLAAKSVTAALRPSTSASASLPRKSRRKYRVAANGKHGKGLHQKSRVGASEHADESVPRAKEREPATARDVIAFPTKARDDGTQE